MTMIRKEDLSLYYYIKDTVLSDFIEIDEKVPLNYLQNISDANSYVYESLTEMIPKPTSRGRGWVYFDENSSTVSGTPEQSNRVIVYDSVNNIFNDSEYMIDYIDGRIVTAGICQPSFVSYYWNYISVVDEWTSLEAAEAPIVVLDLHSTNKSGYQLGAGKKVNRAINIYVFAGSAAERNDISETIYDGLYLKSCPVYEFSKGSVLDYDGTFYDRKNNSNKLTSLFDRSVIPNVIGNLEFHNVSAGNVSSSILLTRDRNEMMLSDINKYRSRIRFNLVHYTHS